MAPGEVVCERSGFGRDAPTAARSQANETIADSIPQPLAGGS